MSADIDFFNEGLATESRAIADSVKKQRPESITKAIELLAHCTGRVVAVGVGKSGVVAQKLASTLTSTGTPAFFLHPTDALHGDLGGLQTGDVVVLISNSGETDELLHLLPFLQKRGIALVSIVGRIDSTLGRSSQAVLDASVAKEICPLNLAPTASTIVALALCDSLAVTVMKKKRVSAEDFAVNHPSGRLGKRLLLKVADLMRGGAENPTCSQDSMFYDVTRAINQVGYGVVNIVDSRGKLMGLVTDGDIRRTIQKVPGEKLGSLKCADFMSAHPFVVRPEQLAYDAFLLMQDRDRPMSVLAVADEKGQAVGILRMQDLIHSGIV